MNELKEAIKVVLGHGLAVTDFIHDIYWANGPIGCQEGDPVPYVISSQDDVKEQVYEEHEDIDNAVSLYLQRTGYV